MLNSPGHSSTASSIPKAPPQGSIPQPKDDGLPPEMVPDWNNIGLFTAGVAVGALLGAGPAFLFPPPRGGGFRDRISRRVRRDSVDEDVWDALAAELERAAEDAEEDEDAARETVVAVKT